MIGFSVSTVAAEAFIFVGLILRPLRRYAVAVGLALHLGISLSMGVFTFGLLMTTTYFLFFSGDWIDRLRARLRPGGAAPQTRAERRRAARAATRSR
jgi:hypothetical protein